MINLPEKIYLQFGEEADEDTDYNECSEVTWCTDKVFNNDIEYTLSSLAEAEIQRLKELIEKAYKAGFKRREHNGNKYENAFDYLSADRTTLTWQQFKQQNNL